MTTSSIILALTLGFSALLIGLLIRESRSRDIDSIPIQSTHSAPLQVEVPAEFDPTPTVGVFVDDLAQRMSRWTRLRYEFGIAVQDHPSKTLGGLETAVWLLVLLSLFDHLRSPASATSTIVWFLIIGWHELGHIICMPFGEFIMFAGGSVWQVLIWVIIAVVWLVFYRRLSLGLIAWAIAGHSLINLARYIDDASARKLQLLFSLDSSHHDWWYLLSHLGMLNYDHALAFITTVLGIVIVLSAVILGIYTTWVLPRTHFGPIQRYEGSLRKALASRFATPNFGGSDTTAA